MDNEHQSEETDRKNNCFSPPEQEVIAPQKSKENEHLKDLKPPGLQGVGLDEAEIVFDFGENFVHLASTRKFIALGDKFILNTNVWSFGSTSKVDYEVVNYISVLSSYLFSIISICFVMSEAFTLFIFFICDAKYKQRIPEIEVTPTIAHAMTTLIEE